MIRLPLLFLLLLSTAGMAAHDDPTVMTINGKDVARSEFEYSFNKNNQEGTIDKVSLQEYVDLFINYKLKVEAALDARLDTLRAFREEFALYRDQQVRPTLVTGDDVLQEARRIYQQTKEAIGPRGLLLPAHIFIRLATKATPAEQTAARERIDSIYQALQRGADFAELARKVSDDAGTAANGGQLPGWIGPNQTFQEFEEAAYALQPGETSRPVLSPAGYHIIRMAARKQLEPFDSLKADIVRTLEMRGIRERIAQQKIQQMVDASHGALTAETLMRSKADSLAAVSDEARYLIQEYHDGLLLYEISNREVWEKAATDEAGLAAYFKDHKKDYSWPEVRYKGIAYHAKTAADVKAVRKCVKKLPFDQWAEALRTTFNGDSVIRVRVEKGIFKPGDNALVDREVFKRHEAEPKPIEGYPFDAVYGKKLKKGPEDYSDVRQEVVADYQDMLEKAWVYDLRRRYPYSVNQEVLKTVNKHQ